jgi:protein-tyrosine phosphatase
MTDLHTHILPGMDDGAQSPADSLELLQAQTAQGVDSVVLTPHFYRSREDSEHFLKRREASWNRLQEAMAEKEKEARTEGRKILFPKLLLGAEVAWVPNIAENVELEKMRLGDSKYFLLELPMYPWQSNMIDQIYETVSACGLTPVLAHLERYVAFQNKEYIQELCSMGVPIQIGTENLLSVFSRAKFLKLLDESDIYMLASDCHNMTTRMPNLGDAAEVLSWKLGTAKAEEILRRPQRLLT